MPQLSMYVWNNIASASAHEIQFKFSLSKFHGACIQVHSHMSDGLILTSGCTDNQLQWEK